MPSSGGSKSNELELEPAPKTNVGGVGVVTVCTLFMIIVLADLRTFEGTLASR